MDKQLEVYARHLGISSLKTISRAGELVRLTEVRGASGISAQCTAVLCLQLAGQQLGQTVDKTAAIKLSATTKKVYTTNLKTLENLLDLQPRLSLKDIAVRFGCTDCVNLASKILNKYISAHGGSDDQSSMDYSTPLFLCAALYTACKQQKTKVDKSKMVELSGSKRTVFDRLVVDMTKLAANISVTTTSSSQGNGSTTFIEQLDRPLQDESSKTKEPSHIDAEDQPEEPYQVWKKRILDNARKQLAEKS